jgi:hypothetical protein
LGGNGGKGTAATRSFRTNLLTLAFEPGPGGGGGGGGGGEGWFIQNTGGGGGGGGAGGAAFLIAAGRTLQVNGDVMALGGDGAHGAFPFTAIAPVSDPLIAAGCGGGGGGGAGGIVRLHGVVAGPSALVLALGGNDGATPQYGPINVDVRTRRQKIMGQPPSGEIQIDGQMPPVAGPAFQGPDMGFVPDLLATTAQKTVAVSGCDVVSVTNDQGTETQFFTSIGDTSVAITLSEGFNVVQARQIGFNPPVSNAPIRDRRFLFLPGTIPLYQFSCVVSPAQATVATERTLQLTAVVTAVPMTPLVWSIAGGFNNDGTISPNTAGALYQAPSWHTSQPISILAASSLDGSRYGMATITVLNGISVVSAAAIGVPAIFAFPSANVGQEITISIPGPVMALTGQGFTAGQAVEFSLTDAANGCVTTRALFPANVIAGMDTLTVTVPQCASPDQMVRVPGHGSVPIQIVPVIESIQPDPANFPSAFINGSGFDCGPGQTQVITQSGQLPAAQILEVTCTQIHISVLPTSGNAIQVTTGGGRSQVFTMP